MVTRDMSQWETAICHNIKGEGHDESIVRGHRLSELIGKITFAEMMFLLLQGNLPTAAQGRVLDALLVASAEHGINPVTIVSRAFASYGTSIQTAVGAGISAFGDRMGGLGEQLAQLLVETVGPLAQARSLDDDGLAAAARRIVEEARNAGGRIPGYGIPLHAADPRPPRVLDVARQEGTLGPYCRLGELVEGELAKARGGRAVAMNLDGVSAVVALDLGFDWRTTRMFLLTPRSVSMGAHFLEEQSQDTTWRHVRHDQIAYTGPAPQRAK